MEKIIVAPQIVIYKNVFKDSSELIDLLEEDDPNSIFDKWRPWYEQGLRKNVLFNHSISLNTEKRARESYFLTKISDIVDDIQVDYFKMYGKDGGTWPEYITDWNLLSKRVPDKHIDYFKYNLIKDGDLNEKKLAMDYHVDEFDVKGTKKKTKKVVTINFYLNNNYSGGEICAYDHISKKSFQYKPNPGDAVIMPSTHPFYHAVKWYSKAERYFLRTFIEYPVNENEFYDDEKNEEQENDFINNHLQLINIDTNEIVVE